MKNTLYSSPFDPKQIELETKSRLTRTAVTAAFIVGAMLLVSFLIFPLTAYLKTTVMAGQAVKTVDWSLLEGISSLITVSLVIGGLAFAYTEYVQTTIQQKRESAEASFNIYKEVYEKLMNRDATDARRWIILNLPVREAKEDDASWLRRTTVALNTCPDGWEGERPPGLGHLKEVLNTLDFIGFVARNYWNMDQALVSWMSPSVAKVWERIGLYVEDEAKRRNEPDFYEAAREFGQSCINWRTQHYPKSTIIAAGT